MTVSAKSERKKPESAHSGPAVRERCGVAVDFLSPPQRLPSSSQTASSAPALPLVELRMHFSAPQPRRRALRLGACSYSPCSPSSTALAPTPHAQAVLVALNDYGRPTRSRRLRSARRTRERRRRRSLDLRPECVHRALSVSL
jgi:hypothetical protein